MIELPAVEAVARMRRGDLTAEDYATALLARCDAGRYLNAFISISPDRVKEAARAADRLRAAGSRLGPLHGLPIPIKDSVNTADHRTTSGTASLRGFRPREDAPVVRALRAAGGLVMGKTNLQEMSLGYTCNNMAFGAVRNPYDPTRIPGGSSGGTAVAVAARMAPLGLAEDTCGSIRVPAALCGIAGLRPTTHRYPSAGVMPLTPLFDAVGPLAREVADLSLFDSVMTGDFTPLAAVRPDAVRLAVSPTPYFAGLDPEVARVANEAMERLAEAGVAFVEAEVEDLTAHVDAANYPIICHDTVRMIRGYLREFETGVTFEQLLAMVGENIRDSLEARAPGGRLWVSDEAYAAARDVHRPALQEAFARCFRATGASAIVYPTTLMPAPPIGQELEVEIGGRRLPLRTAMARNIAPASCAGLPGLVLCAGLTREGLPVGIEFAGPAGADRALLALGQTLESIIGRPPAPAIAPAASPAGRIAP
jgi:indoleacetamide hydrolase